MTSIEEFIKMRESIENLAARIALSIEQKDVRESKTHLDTANRQLEVLKTMIANDTQEMVGRRLSAQLDGFGIRIEKMKVKMPVKRRTERKEQAVRTARPSNKEVLEIVMFERP
jgi:uncharacterized Zn finger protein